MDAAIAILDFFLALFVIGAMAYLLRKIPAYDDVYEVRQEVNYLVWAIPLIYAANLVFINVIYAVAPQLGDWASVLMSTLLFATIFYISVVHPIRRGRELGWFEPGAVGFEELSRQQSISRIASGSNSRTERKLKLRALFSSKDPAHIYTFAQHLVREFSIECMLAFLELLQFKRMLWNDSEFMDSCLDIPDEEREEVGGGNTPPIGKCAVQLPWHKMDASDLVHNALDDAVFQDLIDLGIADDSFPPQFAEYKMRALLLFDKYISEDEAPLEINISHATRRRLTNLMADKVAFMENRRFTPDMLFIAFDDCTRIMYRLMGDAFMRFLQTDKGNAVSELLKVSKKEPIGKGDETPSIGLEIDTED